MAFWKKSGSRAQRTSQPKPPPPAQEVREINGSAKESGTKSTRQSGPVLTPEQLRILAQAAKRKTAAFGEILSLLVRSGQYRGYTLADVEWLVVPALTTRQFALAHAQSKSTGRYGAVGAVLWANVSEEVDRRLRSAPGQPIRLTQQEWTSGDRIWVVVSIGDDRILRGMIKRLQQKEWANKPVKIVALTKDKQPTIATLTN